jgi:2-methylaconitate cis-trans-isomerase PrpF
MGLALTPEQASREQPAVPKIAWLAPAQAYAATDGRQLVASQLDLCGRILSMGALHASFTGTGSIALATAAAIPGTLAHALHSLSDDALLRIGHPAGVLPVGARVRLAGGHWYLEQARLVRTARRLMLGQLVLP